MDVTRSTLAVRTDDQYKALVYGVDRLSKLDEPTARPVGAKLAATVSPTK